MSNIIDENKKSKNKGSSAMNASNTDKKDKVLDSLGIGIYKDQKKVYEKDNKGYTGKKRGRKPGQSNANDFQGDCKRFTHRKFLPILKEVALGKVRKRTIQTSRVGGKAIYEQVLFSPELSDQMKAGKIIMEYGWGKPDQKIETTQKPQMVIVPDSETLKNMQKKEQEDDSKESDDSEKIKEIL